MSSDVVISVRNVSKSFKVSGKGVDLGPSEEARRATSENTRKGRFQALSNVSFDVKEGETVGIVGRNGAGKSTLLRIICGMMHPDSGEVNVAGNAYSVMGMGIGFDRNMTGRENIHIKGAVMGASSRDVSKRFDWIVDFAEVGDYIDQPLRTYSKGMLSRLAFAITFAFDPKILVVDEALSGGDGAFKRKAEARLNEINDSGATILIVSHGAAHHKNLCNRSILLDRGEVLNEGPPNAILGFYDQLLEAGPDEVAGVVAAIRQTDANALAAGNMEALAGDSPTDETGVLLPTENFLDPGLVVRGRSESKPIGAQIMQVEMTDKVTTQPANSFIPRAKLSLRVEAKVKKKLVGVYADFIVKSEDGQELCRLRRPKKAVSKKLFRPGELIEHAVNLQNRLLSGTYYVDVVIGGDDGNGTAVQHRVSDALVFRSYSNMAEGLVDLLP
jgi:lipopolysaccharide transport system ATP-binding protein